MAGTDVNEMAARSRKTGRAVPASMDPPGEPPAATDASDDPRSYTKDRATLVRRLSRLEGQVRGVARMIERDEHCIDILQQTAALRAAVDSIGLLVLEDHVAGCLRAAVETGDAAASTDEVMDVVRRSLGRPIRSARSASD